MTTVTVQLSADLTQRVRDNDTTAAGAVLTLVRASLPPVLAPGQRYTAPGPQVVEIVGFRDDLVILYWPGVKDPGARAGAMPVTGVQAAVAERRWVIIDPTAPQPPVVAWAAGQVVVVGDLRTFGGLTYRATVAHTTKDDPTKATSQWVVA